MQDSKPRDEQCPDKTWACLVESNSRKDRATFVTKVIPLAGETNKNGLDISSSLGDPRPQLTDKNGIASFPDLLLNFAYSPVSILLIV